MSKSKPTMLDHFPGHKYRFIDQTGEGRFPVSSDTMREDLNETGYEAYFTVNGFEGTVHTKEHCTNLNAFFIDIDGRKDIEELERIKERLEPSFITETKNGYHVYWLLDEPIYRDEMTAEEWDMTIQKWELIEQTIVESLNADSVVKDVTRILRVPKTYYWKKSGDAWKGGVQNAPFVIKGIFKKVANTYSLSQVAEAFPLNVETVAPFPKTPQGEKMEKYAQAEKKDFFERVNELYPIEKRPSFQALISGKPDTLPPNLVSRNMALLITATLMRQAEWSKTRALSHIEEVGWHGIETEKGGRQEIENTINSAYDSGYVYSFKNEIIAYNTTSEEQRQIQSAYTKVAKDRREVDKVRFSNYEYELFSRYPYMKKNEVGIVFNYVDGVYKLMTDQDISNIVLNALYEDMLWGYRTKRNVSDKVACLLSIIPDLIETDDKGDFLNCRNGLFQLSTKQLLPHTPDFVSLVQSPVAYDPDATCPVWEACIETWMEGPESEQKKEILQQYSGYILSSRMDYAKALFLVGDGGNGKSTFADTLGMVIGDQGTSRIDLEDLYSTFGLKGLIGKRLNIIEEVGGNYYQAHKLKKLISGEELTINMKYKDQFKFKPQAKFIFAVNTMPRVDDSSSATERRISVVNFNNNFRNTPNTDLRFSHGLLAQELPGILNWMIVGLDSLRKQKKFIVTKEQISTLTEYREENSSVEGFIGECLMFKEKATCTTEELYSEYKDYCVKDGRKFKSKIAFTKEVKAYGKRYGKFSYVERQSSRDEAKFEGVMIRPNWSSTSLSAYQQEYDLEEDEL